MSDWVDHVFVQRCSRWLGMFSTPFSPTYPWSLKKACQGADIVHVHLADPQAVFFYPWVANSNIPLVVTYHMDVALKYSRLLWQMYHFFLRRFLQCANAIIVASPALRESPVLQTCRDRCEVIPFGINLEPFQPTPEVQRQAAELRQRYGAPLVLFVGRLVPYKGLPMLLEAALRISARILIVGTGPEEALYRHQAAALGLSDRVVFVGAVSETDLPAYYHACDLFVLPSINRSEAFGLVQLEAMACGKPVVSTNLPGVAFVNQHEETGLVVEPKNPLALADAINRVLADPAWRAELGRNGRARVEAEFSKEQMVQRTLDLYERCRFQEHHSPLPVLSSPHIPSQVG